MDDTYILNHLKKWAELFYGIPNREYCFSKKKNDYYYFGYKSPKRRIINKVSKAVAVYLCVGMTPKVVERAKIGLEGNKEKPIFSKPEKIQEGRKVLRVPKKRRP